MKPSARLIGGVSTKTNGPIEKMFWYFCIRRAAYVCDSKAKLKIFL